MAILAITPEGVEDLACVVAFLHETDPDTAAATTAVVLDGLDVLARHPLIGRAVEDGKRELVISRGHTGYVALYAYDGARDRVLVHAIRHQRETGYND